MSVEQKSDRDQTRANISAGGWEIAWGDLVNEFDIATGVNSRIIPAIGIAAWVESQIQAQLSKFGQSLKGIEPSIRDQAQKKLLEIVKGGLREEWNIDGLGIKAGVATYHRWWKLPPFGGWNKLPPNYQPFIGFRITKPLSRSKDSAEPIEIQVPGSNADSGPTESPDAPPPSTIGTYEDINLGLGKAEMDVILKEGGQEPLHPVATVSA